jgi:hypothetical protein
MGLRRIKNELGVSVLALMACDQPPASRALGEVDLRRSRILRDAADSVFSLHANLQTGKIRLMQTRSQSAAVVWDEKSGPSGNIVRSDDGFLGFEFEHFRSRIDEIEQSFICAIKAMVDEGKSYREIAKDLRMSHMRVARLYKKWTPVMELRNGAFSATNEHESTQTNLDIANPQSDLSNQELEEWEEAGLDKPIWLEYERKSDASDGPPNAEITIAAPRQMDVTKIPFAAGLRRRSIYDLTPSFDAYGREIFVESEDEHTGKPIIWYQVDKKGIIVGYERKFSTIITTRLGPAPYL